MNGSNQFIYQYVLFVFFIKGKWVIYIFTIYGGNYKFGSIRSICSQTMHIIIITNHKEKDEKMKNLGAVSDPFRI